MLEENFMKTISKRETVTFYELKDNLRDKLLLSGKDGRLDIDRV